MILVFGGTTEGRKAAEVLEESGSEYFYSTKTGEQELTLHHGHRIDGALDAEAMHRFCEEHQIRLIVDAAHPFASRLHKTIMTVAAGAQIPVVRYDRIYPPRDPDITWIDDYSQIPTDIHTLLATTGVQSISKLKPLEAKGMKIWYRILPRESSISLAKAQGATDDQICFYEDGNTIDVDADAILLKESGLSGGFLEKVAAARAKGMRVIALKRPDIIMWNEECGMWNEECGNRLAACYRRDARMWNEECVNGPYGLRRVVEHLLPEFFPLHSGLTTGTCATAAAVAAAIRLIKGVTPSEVPVILPDGETIHVPVTYGSDYASVFKESGDDPDVTNGIEVRARVEHSDHFEIVGGEGVGRFTLPGFDFPPGSPAINKAPREMIARNLDAQCIASISPSSPLRVTISVPQGAEIARRTFNPRLGIEGGISIIGVSGIVKPFSEEAFISSIRKCMEVAKASGTARVVINSGAKSERFLKALYPDLPSQAFVEYGNYIGETLKIANELKIRNVTLGVMLGKAVKLAAGHLDTHSKRSTMDIGFISQMLSESGIDIDISDITLARELWEKIPAPQIQDFVSTVISHCENHCRPLLPNGQLTIMLVDDNGRIMT